MYMVHMYHMVQYMFPGRNQRFKVPASVRLQHLCEHTIGKRNSQFSQTKLKAQREGVKETANLDNIDTTG